MSQSPHVRAALETDAAAIAELIYTTSLACCFTEQHPCPEWYRDSVQASHIAPLLHSTQMQWLVATRHEAIVGVLAIRDRRHVTYFFVSPNHQHQGIGTQLWRYARQTAAVAESLTVRSSLCAVPVYERLGFKASEPPREFNGLHYQTMVTHQE